jgi:hypothetical protein
MLQLFGAGWPAPGDEAPSRPFTGVLGPLGRRGSWWAAWAAWVAQSELPRQQQAGASGGGTPRHERCFARGECCDT